MESSYSVQPAQKYDCATWRLKTMSKYDAAIIGGGFAGLSAAVKLSSHNFRVVVLRSEEHTSELQSLVNLVCRLLLEKINSYCD